MIQIFLIVRLPLPSAIPPPLPIVRASVARRFPPSLPLRAAARSNPSPPEQRHAPALLEQTRPCGFPLQKRFRADAFPSTSRGSPPQPSRGARAPCQDRANLPAIPLPRASTPLRARRFAGYLPNP